MSDRLKKTAPLAVSIGVVAFMWSELTLNFNLHWFTVADGVFGKFGLPKNFQLVLPATFVTWGLYFALGADRAALRKTAIACTTGAIGAVVIMTLGPALAGLPHLWGIALAIGIVGGGLVLLSAVSEHGSLPAAPAFACAASVLFHVRLSRSDDGFRASSSLFKRAEFSSDRPIPSAPCSLIAGRSARTSTLADTMMRRWSVVTQPCAANSS